MFRINNRKVQNKRTGEKFGSEKKIVQYLIRTVQRGNLAEKNNHTCTIIRYPRVVISTCHMCFTSTVRYGIIVQAPLFNFY